jgi:hypothetical protein
MQLARAVRRASCMFRSLATCCSIVVATFRSSRKISFTGVSEMAEANPSSRSPEVELF